MKFSPFLLLLPALASAQSSNSLSVSTSLSTFIGFVTNAAGGRVETTQIATSLFTFTITPSATSAGPSGSAGSGSGSASNNASVTGNASSVASSTSTTPSNLPTAATNVNGGGGVDGAPNPGATGVGGAYGPDDSYTAAAIHSLQASIIYIVSAAAAIGGALAVL
ncbi:hypothetical protein C8J56DRAFT_919074 [Mycena floridula]|nr:hypothetical protein C8J56DRAFT_919074 [Mycena floridula]